MLTVTLVQPQYCVSPKFMADDDQTGVQHYLRFALHDFSVSEIQPAHCLISNSGQHRCR